MERTQALNIPALVTIGLAVATGPMLIALLPESTGVLGTWIGFVLIVAISKGWRRWWSAAGSAIFLLASWYLSVEAFRLPAPGM